MIRLQDGVCAMCTRAFAAIDHDHITEEVRGRLCSQCSTGLGQFADNQELLKRAIDYLDDHEVMRADSLRMAAE